MYIGENYLLECESARRLYHEYAKNMPIVDFHCHLPPKDIAMDRRFQNLGEMWLAGEHYKWRAMRTNGVAEEYCSGNVSWYEKFKKWAETMPFLVRNPLYDWSHLELKRYFNIDELLSPQTADMIWNRVNEMLKSPEYSVKNLIKKSNVRLICTTDDPTDTLEWHIAIAQDKSFDVKVLPSWRPDKGINIRNVDIFKQWVDKLEAVTGEKISNFDSYLDALYKRARFFNSLGCKVSDCGIEAIVWEKFSLREIREIFKKARGGKKVSLLQSKKFESAMMYEMAVLYNKMGWVQQFHIGAIRNNNTKMFKLLGPDTGFDSISDEPYIKSLAIFMDTLEMNGTLPKTILYNLNPVYNLPLITLGGCFQDGTVPCKIQYGAAWWFLDNFEWMVRHIQDLSVTGLLSRFVGMVTDSRSFLSYPRHEYFRRILCNVLGKDMENGRVPPDFVLIGRIVSNICYNNAVQYFSFDLPTL